MSRIRLLHSVHPSLRSQARGVPWARTGIITVLLMLCLCRGAQAQYMIGADVSFLGQAESRGGTFKDNGAVKPPLEILKDRGYNWIRLRVFVNPTDLPNNLQYTIALARTAKGLGFKFLLDLHYSDTWAEPRQQYPPNAWKGMDHKRLVKAVFEYTRDTINSFREAGVLPDMVQIGNEVNRGILWPDGKLPQHWEHFADLLKAGINGVEEGHGTVPRPKIMIHINHGDDKKETKHFLDKLASYQAPFDLIGLSYYPFWQGTLNDLRQNLNIMATAYHKDIVLAEVAYCWSPSFYKTRKGPFPESPEGQKLFLRAVNEIVQQTPDNRGKGIIWWEPVVPKNTRLRDRGFFDDAGNALPVLTVFDGFSRSAP